MWELDTAGLLPAVTAMLNGILVGSSIVATRLVIDQVGPARWVTARVKQARQCGVELFPNSKLCQYKKQKVDPRWFMFGFPLAVTSDILDVLESIAPYVSHTDERLREPHNTCLQRRQTNA